MSITEIIYCKGADKLNKGDGLMAKFRSDSKGYRAKERAIFEIGKESSTQVRFSGYARNLFYVRGR